jgi:DNA repair protein RecO (recombination protein O)
VIVTTPAMVLSAMRYGETSKIVRLATPGHGVVSAIAKGASRPRSRFGASLQVMSIGQAHLLFSQRRDLHTLTGFELAALPVKLAEDVARFSAAAAMAELAIAVAAPEPNPDVFSALVEAVASLERSAPADVPPVALRALWRLIGVLGFAPSLDRCVIDGRDVPADRPAAFSPADGGLLCETCARARDATRLPPEARADLRRLLDSDSPLPILDAPHAAAHHRLLARYVRFHVAEGARLPALEFWEGQGRGLR